MTTRKTGLAGLAAAIVVSLGLQPTSLRAADGCLSAPKGAAPKGSHWYYRIDRATKKNCWYVRAATGPTPADAAAARTLPQAEAPLQPSVANARAEADPASVEPPAAPASDNVAESIAAPADSSPSTVASRWLDQPAAEAAPPAADIRSPSPSASFPPLLLVIIGALAAAGGVAGVVYRFGHARRRESEDFRHEQHAPWDVMDIGATIRSPPLATEAAAPQGEAAPERHEAVIPDEIVRLLSTLSKETPA